MQVATSDDATYRAALATTAQRGLSSSDAARLLVEIGPNDLQTEHGASPVRELAAPFANPLVLTLLFASAISAYLGEIASAAIIALMVLLSAALHLTQTYRSQRAIERLRGSVAPTATVLRDGAWCDLPRQQVVPGDCIRLAAGDLVPADARLIEAKDLHVQQAALTGESLPVEKSTAANGTQATIAMTAADDAQRVFLGTSVISGTGIATVTATGRATAYGDIAKRLAARAPETEFERGMRNFSALITRTIVGLTFFLVAMSLALHRDPLESLLFAVALAVGLVPEFLPMITSVTLANGAVRMARQKVIVKHLQAIQNLGSVDVLCSDKTGTLTSGEVRVVNVVPAAPGRSERVLELARLNSRFETGIKSPLDAALLRDAPAEPGSTDGYRKIDEIPFDFERRLLSVVVAHGGERYLITKGAPESVIAHCTACEDADTIRELDVGARARFLSVLEEASRRGERLLAVAWRPVEPRTAYTTCDEEQLTLAGFVAFSDPPLTDAAATLDALRADGVRVKILTGDSELIAAHVCAEAGLAANKAVVGDDIDQVTDAALGPIADRTTVFARVSPAQKNRILLALKARGHVVGFLGDGVNDAPALHAADVGISVAGAVDVAREAADVVLLERNLRVLHTGIMEGRKAFGNMMKYFLMGTSSNFGNMFSMAGAVLVLPFLPMLPMQILLNNFLYDLAQVTIPTDRVDDAWIRSPRRWDMRLVRTFMITVGPISSVFDFLTFYALLIIFHASETLFHTGWFVESLVTQTLVLLVIRTTRNPLRDPPSTAFAASAAAIVVLGMILPYLPVAALLGFTPLPAPFFLLLIVLTVTYLTVVEYVKIRVVKNWFPEPDGKRREMSPNP